MNGNINNWKKQRERNIYVHRYTFRVDSNVSHLRDTASVFVEAVVQSANIFIAIPYDLIQYDSNKYT